MNFYKQKWFIKKYPIKIGEIYSLKGDDFSIFESQKNKANYKVLKSFKIIMNEHNRGKNIMLSIRPDNRKLSKESTFQQKKKQQLEIFSILEFKLKNKFTQQKEQKQDNQQKKQIHNKVFIKPSKIQKQIKQQESESQSFEYEYDEYIQQPIYRSETATDIEVQQNTQSIKPVLNKETKYTNQQHILVYPSKKQSLKQKKIIKSADQVIKYKLKQKLQQNQQPLSPPSSIQILDSHKIQLIKNPSQKIKEISDIEIKPQKSQINRKTFHKKEQDLPIDSEFSQYQLSSQPRQIRINLRNETKKQKFPEKSSSKKILQQESKELHKLSLSSSKNLQNITVNQNLKQIYKFQQKEKDQILKTIKNDEPKISKTQQNLTNSFQESFENDQKFKVVKQLAKIFIEEQYSFSKIKEKKKYGSISVNLKSLRLGNFGNLSTLLIKTTIREIQKQLVQKCKLNIKKLSTQEFNFLRTPLLKAKEIMPKDHLNTFLCIVGFAFKLNITQPSQKDVIALYQFMLIKLQKEMKDKQLQKIQNIQINKHQNSTKSDQRSYISIEKKDNSVFSNTYKSTQKVKEVKKIQRVKDNLQEQDFLKQLEDFVKRDRKSEK